MKKKLVKKIVTLLLAVIAISSVTVKPVSASEITESTYTMNRNNNFSELDSIKSYQLMKKERIKTGEKFLDSNGNIEQVIRVNKDGSFITEELEISRNTIMSRNERCSHPTQSLVALVDLGDEIKHKKTASCCYKYRSVTKYRCKKCGNSSIKQFGAWHEHKKHSYPLFSKKCKECGFKK